MIESKRDLSSLSAPAQAMPRVEAIWQHPIFQRELSRIDHLEADRRFCKHDLTHLLDVARVALIRLYELEIVLPRDVVYAASFLHDIGRAEQYERGIPHDRAGATLAAKILATLPSHAQFSSDEAHQILRAIRHHRSQAVPPKTCADMKVEDADARVCGTDANSDTQSKAKYDPSARFERSTAPEYGTDTALSGTLVPEDVLAQVIAWADKASRPCYACPAREVCKWPDERKNLSPSI
ncbi:HD domain-containing protein [Collinsella sp. AGMB00827]|uniref:HD domain-containing protein n=1 Tax=Collinsella ureilytica TaxID=2869515 RepID=A0ABS7MKU8_9ACTN|nr:HD domain-containing protein [Collinsella urealyticum]MBY4797015.1 HD domain-containing protein [Collinsella urealyticum]